MPDFNDSRPVFVQIADDLRDQIKRGTLEVGTRLPSQAELAERYGVALNTLRTALRALTEEGLVSTQSTRGTFVLKVPEEPAPSSKEILQQLMNMTERLNKIEGRLEEIERRRTD